MQVFGSDEVFVVDTGPSALAMARSLFLADRISVDEFERMVERALAGAHWSEIAEGR